MPYRSSLCLMAAMVREGEISPVELVEAHLRRIESENSRVNAFVRVFRDEALAAARRAEAQAVRVEITGMLHGVPVTVKDCFDVAGVPTLAGSRFRLGHRAARDAGAVARLRDEGAIILGKTNCPEFLAAYETDNHVTGRTVNPWDPERTPGGSSGGEAAAIASCCSPGGLASDGGGSIRVPAHFCGVAGLKPTPGRVSAAGHFPVPRNPTGFLTAAGPMARNAKDLRLLFAALAGYDARDPLSAPAPLRAPSTAGLRAGVMERPFGVPVEPEIADAVERAGKLLQSMGLAVEPWAPRGIERAPNLWWYFFGQLPAPFIRQLFQGREEEAHWTATEFLRPASDSSPATDDVLAAFAASDAMRAALVEQMEDAPVLLMPPCAVEAFPHRARRWLVDGREIGLFQAMMPATAWNLLGFPAVVVPMGVTPRGLPVGVQLVGRPWEDELLLELAIELEEARGPFQVR